LTKIKGHVATTHDKKIEAWGGGGGREVIQTRRRTQGGCA